MRKLAAVLSIVALVGVGCGDDDGESGSASGSGTGTGDTKQPVKLSGTTNNHGLEDVTGEDKAEVELELDDSYFAPTFVKVKAGQSVSVKLHNEGTMAHTFTAEGGPDEQLGAGDEKTVTVTGPSSGVLVYYCRFHQGQGMQGALYLKEGDTAGSSAGSSTSAPGYGY